MESRFGRTAYPFVHELYRAEQLHILQKIIPWVMGGHGIGILASIFALIVDAGVWQFWTLLVVLVFTLGLTVVADYFRRYNRPKRSGVFLVGSMMAFTITLPVLFGHMIITSAILALMIVLTAGILYSPRVATVLMTIQIVLGLVYLGLLGLDPERGSIPYQPLFFSPLTRDLVNYGVFIFSLLFGTRLISINWQSMQNALARVVERSWGWEETKSRLADEIHDRKNVENNLWLSRQAYRLLADAAINAEDLEDLCQKILTGLVDVWSVDRGVMYLCKAEQTELVPTAEYGWDDGDHHFLRAQDIDDQDSLPAWVAREKEFLFYPSENNQAFFQDHSFKGEIEKADGLVALPLLGSGQGLLGVILLVYQHQQRIQPGMRWFFDSFIDLTATALENKRSEVKLAEQTYQLRKTNDFITTLNRVLLRMQGIYSPQKILHILEEEFHQIGLEFLLAVFDDRESYFIEYLSNVGELPGELKEGMEEVIRAQRFQADTIPEGLLGREKPLVLQGPHSLLSALSHQLPDKWLDGLRETLGLHPGMNFIYLPLRFREELIGFITVWGEELQRADARPLSVFSGQFVAALENARLYSEERTRSKELMETSKRLEILRVVDLVTIKSETYRPTADLVLKHLHQEYPRSEGVVVVFGGEGKYQEREIITLDQKNPWREILSDPSTEPDMDERQEEGYRFVADIAPGGDLSPFQEKVSQHGLKSYLSVALTAEGGQIGLLILGWDKPHSISGEMVDTVQELAYSLSIAVHQHHLRMERKRQNEQIAKSLREKEIMLSEIHHRVKNNMQVILSLLRLQSRDVADEELTDVFNELRNRIHSLTLVHDMLYEVDDLSDINLEGYFKQLTDHILRTYQSGEHGISIDLEIEEVDLDLSQVVPCGLLINELVSNSLKYAFPGGEGGTIQVKLKRGDDGINLEVSDDGVSLPEDISVDESGSLGLKIVQMLAQQLEGKMDIQREKGTRVRINF